MKDKRLAMLSLSKEVFTRTPLEMAVLLLRLPSRVEELESRLIKHSGNSDKPSSSGSPFRKRKEEKAAKTTALFPLRCSCGGAHFRDEEPFYTHQFFELPKIETHIEHLILHRARCADCGSPVKAALPPEKRTGYGPRLSVMVFELLAGSWSGLRDGYAHYRKWAYGRQACLPPLIRQARGVSEPSHPEVAACGLWALNRFRRLCHMDKEPPANGEWNAFYARLMRLFRLRRDRKDEVSAFVRHLMRELDSLWAFPGEPGVAAINNHAKRSLYFPVTWRKASYGILRRQRENFVERLLSPRQTCRLQGKRTHPHLVEALARCLFGSRPAAHFVGSHEPCRSLNSAYSLLSLSLSLSLSLLNSTYLLLLKQSWQCSARAAFCFFSRMATNGNFLCRREGDAL